VSGPVERVDAPPPPPPLPNTPNQLQGVFRWKGSDSGNGLYFAATLTPQSVNSSALEVEVTQQESVIGDELRAR
jgi:hypothetical protein